ncbi:MAG: PEP-CTERM sorting domain-containing protein [Candidatus Competibacter sp.]
MKLKSCVYAIAALAWAVTSSASAAIIFEDDFERANNNSAGSNWLEEVEAQSNDVAIFNNQLRLRDNRFPQLIDAAASTISLSTVGYTNVEVIFDWSPWNSENSVIPVGPFNNFGGDFLFVSWRSASQGNNWTEAASYGLGDIPNNPNTVTLGSGAAGISDLQIRLWTDVNISYLLDSVSFEGALIDNFKVAGTPVPEPTSMALLGIGLAGLGVLRRRKRAA